MINMGQRFNHGNFIGAKRNIVRALLLLTIAILSLWVDMQVANAAVGVDVKDASKAHVIERIEITQVGDEAEIQIIFDQKVQYLRQASLQNGEIHIFFNLLEKPPERDPLNLNRDPLNPNGDPLNPNRDQFIPEDINPPPSKLTRKFSVVYPGLDGSLTLKFDEPVIYRITAGHQGRSISVFTPVLVAAGSTAPAPSPEMVQRTQQDIEIEAKQFIDSAKYAIQHDQIEAAIETLNRLLLLPPNEQSQSAQELIGEAREMNGDVVKARAEYELYLTLYPEAADINLVRERLAHLPLEAPKKERAPIVNVQKFVEEKMTVFGSLSQYYYHGNSNTNGFTISGGVTTPVSSSVTDQSQLLSMFDISGRKRTERVETRLVMREYFNSNFLPGQKNDRRLNTLYIEQAGRDRSYLYRLGRQYGSGGGVLGNFDGAFAGFNINQTWRVNGVAGTPVEYVSGGSVGPKKTFKGMSIDLTRLPEQWSGTSYLIQQRVEGFVDRQALGMEARYFDVRQNYMAVLEYDTTFKKVNLGMLQRNWTSANETNYNLLLDHRRSPPLQLTNGMVGQPTQFISAALQSGSTLDGLRADAIALSQISNVFSIGMSHPASPQLRVGADFRINNSGGTGATNLQPATPGGGNIYYYSLNALGNSLLFENDLGVANVSYTSAPTYKGQSLSFTQVETFRKNWRVDMLLQLYNQNDNSGVHTTQVRPSAKLNYRVANSATIEGEAGVELFNTVSATQNDKRTRKYFYVGYRWDFQ